MSNPRPTHLWQKGVSGNPKGRPPKGDTIADLMRDYLDATTPGQKKNNKEIFIEKIFIKAVIENDIAAQKLIWNYLDGMPRQSVEHTGRMTLEQFLTADDEEE